MTPEEKARVKIDRMFEDAGWQVVDRDFYSPTISAVAIREGLLKGNKEADYFLFLGGKAVGVLEAKRAEVDVSASIVCEQTFMYAKGVPNCYQTWGNPLPFGYQSNGEETYYQDFRGTDGLALINRIHTPKEMAKMLGIADPFAGLPALKKRGLRDCQYEAITELEKSFRAGQNRALMVLATGSGKTYTACLASYRFLAYTPMKRVLFLVDRNNLGKQAEGEFGMFRLTENGDPFNVIYTVNRLKSSSVPSDSNVVISTIQRLFSLLKGDAIIDTDEDDDDIDSPVEIPENPQLPKDFFDLIIIDECHRSIYGNWKKVLDYFSSAKMLGLTATPVPETMAFFNNNRIVNYTLEKSIVDGVNVDCRVFRIKTEATENGGAIREGDKLRVETKYTGKVETINQKETKQYTREELNRSIVNPAQIKLVLETYKDSVYTEMFTEPQREPNMDYLPKTLIFALNEAHANNIVQIAKEVFGHTGENDSFVQKITYSAGDSNELIRHFRNDREFRIAVTCTLVATGTDVKPLEVVMFMRDVQSEPLYIQMKGRGVRTIGDEQLRNVTPNAISKDFFYLVDAVGVTEHEKYIPTGGEPVDVISLKRLLELITHGFLPDDILRTLASRLARIYNKATAEQRNHFTELAGADMKDLSSSIFEALDNGSLPPFEDVNQANNERKGLVAPLANHPQARQELLILNAGFVETLMPGEDTLIYKGFSKEEAIETTSAFEKYCAEHQDDIKALSIIWNNQGEPLTYSLLKDLENTLRMANSRFTAGRLWNCYALTRPESVRKHTTREEQAAMTNIIQLTRFAYKQIEQLDSIYSTASKYFNLWCGQRNNEKTAKQKEVMQKVVDYIATNGACTIKEIRDDDKTRAAQIIQAFAGLDAANMALDSLYRFVIYRKTA